MFRRAEAREMAELLELLRSGSQSPRHLSTISTSALISGGVSAAAFAASNRISNDGWDGYPAARERLLASLANSSASNVVLGGDVHANWVGHVKADYSKPRSRVLASEFCGTSITSRPTPATREVMDARLAKNPHYVFAENEKRGYGVCELTPAGLKTTLRVVDDVTKSDSAISTLASFAVQIGKPAVERV